MYRALVKRLGRRVNYVTLAQETTQQLAEGASELLAQLTRERKSEIKMKKIKDTHDKTKKKVRKKDAYSPLPRYAQVPWPPFSFYFQCL
jgi:D-alanyl-D-alanine carboxypeptidase